MDELNRDGIDRIMRTALRFLSTRMDEIAWLSQDVLADGDTLVKAGFKHFNSATDQVMWTTPQGDGGIYKVQYEFFRPAPYPGSQQWRIEMMQLHGGQYGPVHRDRKVGIVHASWKCRDELAYEVTVRTLVRAGASLIQTCNSEYGAFSYWRTPGQDPEDTIYIKPRVNLRGA